MNNFSKVLLIILLSVIGGIVGSQILVPKEPEEVGAVKTQLIEKKYYIQENEAIAEAFLKAKKSVGSFSCEVFYQKFSGEAVVLTRDGLAVASLPGMPLTCKGKIKLDGKEYDFNVEKQEQNLSLLRIRAKDLSSADLADLETKDIGKNIFSLVAQENSADLDYAITYGYIRYISAQDILISKDAAKDNLPVFDARGRLLGINKGENLITASILKTVLDAK